MRCLLIAASSTLLFCLALSALIVHDVMRRERRAGQPVDPPRPPTPAEIAWSLVDTLRPPLRCNASWYASPEHGRKTASGEIFDSTKLTCATWRGFRQVAPFGSALLARNSFTARIVLVRVNDNMPDSARVRRRDGSWAWVNYAREGRMVDFSRAAAESLGGVKAGVFPVECWSVGMPLEVRP